MRGSVARVLIKVSEIVRFAATRLQEILIKAKWKERPVFPNNHMAQPFLFNLHLVNPFFTIIYKRIFREHKE